MHTLVLNEVTVLCSSISEVLRSVSSLAGAVLHVSVLVRMCAAFPAACTVQANLVRLLSLIASVVN